MKTISKKMCKGFTLIEMLVVVLIIGILAAVALPQYQQSSDKALFSTIMPIVKAVKEEQELFYQANAKYATSWDELGTGVLPNGFEIVNVSGHNMRAKYAQYFIDLAPGYVYGHINNPEISYLLGLKKDNSNRGKIECWSYGGEKKRVRANKVCKSLSKKKTSEPYSGYEVWNLR